MTNVSLISAFVKVYFGEFNSLSIIFIDYFIFICRLLFLLIPEGVECKLLILTCRRLDLGERSWF